MHPNYLLKAFYKSVMFDMNFLIFLVLIVGIVGNYLPKYICTDRRFADYFDFDTHNVFDISGNVCGFRR